MMGVLPAQLLTEKGTEEEDNDDEAVSVLEATCLRLQQKETSLPV